MTNVLKDLVEACHSLPSPSDDFHPEVRRAPAELPPAPAAPAPPPRRELGGFLRDLSTRLEPQLSAALERAQHAWDQVDATAIVDGELRARAASLAAAWRASGGAEAAMALMTLETALDLVTVIERRLATLVRLRLRSTTPELLVDNRPFLDVPRALAEVARRWS